MSNNHKKTLVEINNENSFIDESYLDSLIDNGVSKSDLKLLFKKNNLSNLLLHLNEKNAEYIEKTTTPRIDESEEQAVDKYGLKDDIKEETPMFDDWYKNIQSVAGNDENNPLQVPKWRTAEQQVLYVLNKNGFNLTDVSKQNLGYDLEGTDPFGSNVCIEVKSINYPGQSFKMTNNEYAVAQLKGNSFLIAVAFVTGSKLKLALYPNPTNRLKLNRQCVQWVWECNEYVFQPRVFEL